MVLYLESEIIVSTNPKAVDWIVYIFLWILYKFLWIYTNLSCILLYTNIKLFEIQF